MSVGLLHVGLTHRDLAGPVTAHAVRESLDGIQQNGLCGKKAKNLDDLVSLEWTDELPGVPCCIRCVRLAGLLHGASANHRLASERLRSDAHAAAKRAGS